MNVDATTLNAKEIQPRLKVSVTARLVAALCFTIPAIGGALSSLLLMNVFRELRANENAGIGAVMAGMKASSLPAIVSLYLAAICGLALIILLVVRMIVQTKTASPPFWFFVLGGILCFLPAGLFWKAQLLVLEVLSPGSSVGVAGISGVAGDLSRLLPMSIIAAPVVLIVLAVLSVLPLSFRSRPKVVSLLVATFIEIILIATAIAAPFLIDGPKRKNEIVKLPDNVKYADQDANILKETSLVLTLTSDDKLYERQSRDVNGRAERTETVITNQELPDKINRSMETKTPDNRIVYFKSDMNASYGNVLQIFDAVRKADVDKVGLVVIGEKNAGDPYQISPLSFQVKLPMPMDKAILVRPNPLVLVAAFGEDGRLRLNSEEIGTMSDHKKLDDRLREVFKERENNGVFREGTNEVEKTVYLKVPKSAKYGDFIKLVEVVKGSGAEPIGIQIDDVSGRTIESIK